MPEFFEFKRNDPYVVRHLSGGEITGVRRWQSDRLTYQFSFHTQHEAGWPCYLSEQNGPGRNLPKINLKVPTNPPALLQGDSVRDNAIGADFRDVIIANVALFQKLASAYYEGTEQAPVQTPGWVVAYPCTLDRSNTRIVYVKLPLRAAPIPEAFWANFSRFARKPKCPMHKNSECMGDPKLKQIQYNEFVKVTNRFDDNGEVTAA
ncbi:MAG TPA: hypothetical protein VMH81_06575 [Bryobacteraceae bacterium]|nr:hypothetical protein [Bryobacteraceae bacterium]